MRSIHAISTVESMEVGIYFTRVPSPSPNYDMDAYMTTLTLPNPMVLTPSRSSRHGKGASVVLCLQPRPNQGQISSRQPCAPPCPSPMLTIVALAFMVLAVHVGTSATLSPTPTCRPPASTSACPSLEGGPCPCFASCHGIQDRHGLHPPVHASNLIALGECVFSNMHSATPNECV